MLRELKQNDIKKIYPQRNPHSHKGMNGRVMIIGGSDEYYGAPILSAMGALYSGADLVYLCIPEMHAVAARSFSPDFIVRPFAATHLTKEVAPHLLTLTHNCDAVLIGPGLGDSPETMEAVAALVEGINLPTVLDASAIQVFQEIAINPTQPIVITPHHGEFEALTGKSIKIATRVEHKETVLKNLASSLGINIVLKGPQDLIASEKGEVVLNTTGNAGMTVGGSGDVLSGFITSLIAQGAEPANACQAAAYIFGKTGDELFKNKGYNYTASDLALELPYVIASVK